MSEVEPRSSYSPAAQALLDGFCSWDHRPDERAKYEARGLTCTNNLALRMDAFTQGPESLNYRFYFQTLPAHLQALLVANQAANADLWATAVDAYRARTEIASVFADQLRNQDPQATATGEVFEALAWQQTEHMTAVLETLEPLDPEDALTLCR